jgi:hypothetical protein
VGTNESGIATWGFSHNSLVKELYSSVHLTETHPILRSFIKFIFS